jgi:hypothetical protein
MATINCTAIIDCFYTAIHSNTNSDLFSHSGEERKSQYKAIKQRLLQPTNASQPILAKEYKCETPYVIDNIYKLIP